MYPFLRLATNMITASREPALGTDATHISTHIAMPWDIDMFMEVNNGRLLSLYDLGRFGLAVRIGLIATLRREGWWLTVAGSSVQYRRRLLAFQRYTMHSQAVGRDERFFYLSQSMWRGDTALSHAFFRTAVVDKGGIVETDRVAVAMGRQDWNPDLPQYARNWIEAEATRPWPPAGPHQS